MTGEAECEVCGSPFRVFPSQGRKAVAFGHRPPRFCSRACMGVQQSVERRRPPTERFWSKVDKDGICWLWRGAIGANGYGAFRGPDGKTTTAHKFAYEALVGPVPSGLHLDHLCRIRSCVRPDHLEPVTPALNVRRAAVVRSAA